MPRFSSLLAIGLMLTSLGACAGAQTGAKGESETLVATNDVSSSLPDSPDAGLIDQGPTGQGATAPPVSNTPSKRVLGIIPNYRSVGVGAQLPPQTIRNKFTTAASDTIDPSAFALAALLAGYNDARAATPEFHGGAVAYGRYFWHSLADQSIENMSVEFLVPALTHEDTRYYTLGTGGKKKRLEYSLTRIFITRADSGKETVNLSELLGAGLAAGVSSRYYPVSQRDAGSVLQQYALNLGIDAASYALREFDNDISRAFSRKHDQ
ncbi:hypothetical protein GRAN_3281 [Granulicella sibirica]|uniref:Lipoprotein n=1 Tax=Granulicella sibirica TaxID=2479048 RepID=A0A4V1L5N9_9BACT|nr:hypothetical protein GRAN_3281 [Granulicella sibirica]